MAAKTPLVDFEKKSGNLLNRRFVGLSLAECLVLLMFTAIAAVAVWFHEPWADEAQAWLIARDLGIRGILHQMGYEGSPPLWHLLLWVLIRLHLPYAALGAVSLTLVAAGMYIWLRWSPLPAPVRLLVPFAFYYQYQYAVVARSYALSTFLAFAAVALWRAKPVRIIPFGLVLALLAQTNLYGFMIAGGIACAFAWECFLGLPQTASFADPNSSYQRSRCFRPGFRGHCQVSRKATSRLQFQGSEPTSKREPRSAASPVHWAAFQN